MNSVTPVEPCYSPVDLSNRVVTSRHVSKTRTDRATEPVAKSLQYGSVQMGLKIEAPVSFSRL
jgi:hypothetical protein